jgi:cysteine-rich repeat protein
MRDGQGRLAFRQLRLEGPAPGPLCGAGPILVSSDGAYVYVAATCAGSVRVFAPDAMGILSALESPQHEEGRPDGLEEALLFPIAMCPDGRHLYAAGSGRELGVFRRDAATGLLTFQEGRPLPVPATRTGNPAVREVGTIACSPDSRNLYAAAADPSGDDDALLVFARDPGTGSVRLLEAQEDGANGFASLTHFFSVVVSPDGRNVYAGSRTGEPVLVSFARNIASGALTALQAQLFAYPLVSAGALAMSPDGRFLYAGGESTVAVLHRDVETGELTLLETYRNGYDGFQDLDGIAGWYSAPGIAVSPAGEDLYVASSRVNAVVQLRKLCGNGAIDPGEGCDDGRNDDGDGCSASCSVEACWSCAGAPSTCSPSDGLPCDDRNPCTTGSACHAGRCDGAEPANEGGSCDDGDACTSDDTCRGGRCVGGSPVLCGPCQVCDRRYGCTGALRSDCFMSSRAASLRLSAGSPETRALSWRWSPSRTGARPVVADFGDPRVSSAYTLCVFDRRELAGARRRRHVVASLRVAAGGSCSNKRCWRLRRGHAFVYGDRSASSDGVSRLILRPGRSGGHGIELEAHGPSLQFRPPPLERDVTVQLVSSDGVCLQADYGDLIKKNDATGFRARAGEERYPYR